jgi:hypothetical protein
MFAALTARLDPRPVCPMKNPIGSAMAAAMRRDVA